MSEIEEDIKIIESTIEEYENCSVPEIDMQVDITFRKRQSNALKNVSSEREQDKARIKELEEKNITLKSFTSSIFNDNFEKELESEIAGQVYWESTPVKEIEKLWISKQKIKDKIEELKRQRRELGFKTYLRKEDIINDDREKVIKIQILEKLLQESEDK